MEEGSDQIEAVLGKFFVELASAETQVLLLDYDGTLAPFHVDPARAMPYPGIREALFGVRDCKRTRVILVSGRSAREVSHLLDVKGIEVWGCHGMEHLSGSGQLQLPTLDPRTTMALKRTSDALIVAGLEDSTEEKATGYAVHWRGLSAARAEQLRHATQLVWSENADKDVLRILHFDGGIEICASARNKGDVVRQVVNGLKKPYSLAYLGDDLTDEDAFTALKGIGLGILVRESSRKTNADIWIRPPEEVLKFLERWTRTCETQP